MKPEPIIIKEETPTTLEVSEQPEFKALPNFTVLIDINDPRKGHYLITPKFIKKYVDSFKDVDSDTYLKYQEMYQKYLNGDISEFEKDLDPMIMKNAEENTGIKLEIVKNKIEISKINVDSEIKQKLELYSNSEERSSNSHRYRVYSELDESEHWKMEDNADAFDTEEQYNDWLND